MMGTNASLITNPNNSCCQWIDMAPAPNFKGTVSSRLRQFQAAENPRSRMSRCHHGPMTWDAQCLGANLTKKKQNSHELTRNPTGIVWGCLKPYCFPHHHFPPEIPRVKTQFNITQWQFNSQAVLQPQQHSQEAKVKRLSKPWVGSESKRRTMHLWMTERDTTTLVKWNLNNYNSQWTSAQSYQVCRAVIFSEQERATVGQ